MSQSPSQILLSRKDWLCLFAFGYWTWIHSAGYCSIVAWEGTVPEGKLGGIATYQSRRDARGITHNSVMYQGQSDRITEKVLVSANDQNKNLREQKWFDFFFRIFQNFRDNITISKTVVLWCQGIDHNYRFRQWADRTPYKPQNPVSPLSKLFGTQSNTWASSVR